VTHLRGEPVTARVRYPGPDGAAVVWNPAIGALRVTLARAPLACLVELRA
jgi:hypothetical protein